MIGYVAQGCAENYEKKTMIIFIYMRQTTAAYHIYYHLN